MTEPEPNYASYSLADLFDARANVDRARYPDRFALIERLIRERRESQDHQEALRIQTRDSTRESLVLDDLAPITGIVVMAGGAGQALGVILAKLGTRSHMGIYDLHIVVPTLDGVDVAKTQLVMSAASLLLAILLVVGGYGFWRRDRKLIPAAIVVMTLYGFDVAVDGYGWRFLNTAFDFTFNLNFGGLHIGMKLLTLMILGYVIGVFDAVVKVARLRDIRSHPENDGPPK